MAPVPVALRTATLMLLMAAAAFLSVHGAAQYHLHPDEMVDVGLSTLSAGDILRLWPYEAHPPLGQLMRHYWMDISAGTAFVRSFSLILGLALIALYYALMREIAGEFAGLVAASLVAFGYGDIIQDYSAHNYSLLSCLLACMFLCYWRWRKEHSPRALLWYGLFGLLGILTHFTTLFALFAIGAYEMIGFARRREWKAAVPWIAMHGLLAALALLMLYASRTELVFESSPSTDWRFTLALLYPSMALKYLLPGPAFALLFIALPFAAGLNDTRLRALIGLNLIAFAAGAAYALHSYISALAVDRHILWMLPFVVTALSLMIALASERFTSGSVRAQLMVLVLLFAASAYMYNPVARFDDQREYAITEPEWQQLVQRLDALSPTDAIIAERSDAQLLERLYPYMGPHALLAGTPVLKAPYAHTFLLVDPYYPRQSNLSALNDTAGAALAQGMLDHTQRLVFFATRWSLDHLAGWAGCAALEKQVVAFPRDGLPVSKDKTQGLLLIVSKDAFTHDMLAPGGKAHGCFSPAPKLIP